MLRDQAGGSVYSKVASSRPRGATLTEPVTLERDGHVLLIGTRGDDTETDAPDAAVRYLADLRHPVVPNEGLPWS